MTTGNEPWRHAKNLQQTLDTLLAEAITASGLCRKIAEQLHSQQQQQGERSALSSSFGLLVRNKKKKEFIGGWLNYQISLTGDGLPQRADGQPCAPVLHVAHWACEFAFEYDAYVGFPASLWQPWQQQGDSLLWWEESDSQFGPEWTYTLDLAALNSDDALRAAVVAPALALLAGKPVAEALPATTPGLLRYGSVQDANGDTDLRVL